MQINCFVARSRNVLAHDIGILCTYHFGLLCIPAYVAILPAQKLEAAAKDADAQSSKIFRLEVVLAEAQKKLQTTIELEKELNHYRYVFLAPCIEEECPCRIDVLKA